MKGMAQCILALLLLMIFFEPILEGANVMREKVILQSALNTAFRVARDESMRDLAQRNLDAEILPDVFRQKFADAFQTVTHSTWRGGAGTLVFAPESPALQNEISVALNFDQETDPDGRLVTQVEARLTTKYKFKTGFLKRIEATTEYFLVEHRAWPVRVIN
jgi:hypothetical protein